jgi:site-specific DNA-methyltransferase (adenine-specific)
MTAAASDGVSAERFAALEATIEGGWQAFLEVGRALVEIRDTNAYRAHAGFLTFEDYLRCRWGISRARGYQLIQAATVMGEMSTIVDTTTLPRLGEWHLRQIAALPTNERRAIAEQLARGELSPRRLRDLAADTRHRSEWRVKAWEVSPVLLPECVLIQRADAAALPWEEGAVDLIVTSPPYCLGIDQAGYVDYTDYQAYITRLVPAWATELYRVSAPWGRLCLNVPLDIGRPRQPIGADWLQVLRSAGWRYRTTIVWHEGNISRGTARGSLDSAAAPNLIAPVELVLVLHKGPWNLSEVRGQRPTWGPPDLLRQEWLEWSMAAWRFPGERAERVGGYPAAFPEELPWRCIKLLSFPGAVVADPFVGSGTTAVLATSLGRRVMACDMNAQAVELTKKRIATTLASESDGMPAARPNTASETPIARPTATDSPDARTPVLLPDRTGDELRSDSSTVRATGRARVLADQPESTC